MEKQVAEDTENSDNLLSLLALEILMKAIYLKENCEPYKGRGHSFRDLFVALTEETQKQVVDEVERIAIEREIVHFDFNECMCAFGKNFIRLWYSYEHD